MADHEKSVQLRHILQNLFTQKDLKTLCFDLKNVDFEDLEGNSKEERIMSLLQDLDNRNRLGEVESWISQHRSDIDLNAAAEEFMQNKPRKGTLDSVEVEDNTFLRSKIKTRGKGVGLKRLFSWRSEIDISTNDGADTHGE